MEVAIRGIGKGDKRQLMGLIESIYNELPYAFTFKQEPTKQELEELFARKLELSSKGKVIDLVASIGKELVGECELSIVEQEGGKAGIVGILVKHEYRRRGVGKELMNKALASAKNAGVSMVVAEMSKENTAALAFFSALGFEKVAEASGKISMRRVLA